MTGADIENLAGFSRATCGWRLPGLDLGAVWNYWRDVHSPAISRRAGIHVYRHYRWDPVDPDLFGPLDGVGTVAPDHEQLQWMSDIIYRDQDALDTFYRSPESPAVTAKILGDIEMIVDKSTTYLTLAENMSTVTDSTPSPTPQGAPALPHFGVFVRQGAVPDDDFRHAVRAAVQEWGAASGVLRVRVNLFERPDMEADKRAGYPVKTHPVELQYQALIEIVLADRSVAPTLMATASGPGLAAVTSELHAYPVSAVYSFVWDGAPTVVGLRGYPAVVAIEALGADHALDPGLLEWMYGPIAHRGDGADEIGER